MTPRQRESLALAQAAAFAPDRIRPRISAGCALRTWSCGLCGEKIRKAAHGRYRLARAWRRLRGLPIASNGCWCAECLRTHPAFLKPGKGPLAPLPPAQQHALAERLKARDNG